MNDNIVRQRLTYIYVYMYVFVGMYWCVYLCMYVFVYVRACALYPYSSTNLGFFLRKDMYF